MKNFHILLGRKAILKMGYASKSYGDGKQDNLTRDLQFLHRNFRIC
jgi:hypothetical protein